MDCGGPSCLVRCPSSSKCSVDTDCNGISCMNGTCSDINWMRIFLIAGVAVAVIVMIALVSVCAAIFKKRRAVVGMCDGLGWV